MTFSSKPFVQFPPLEHANAEGLLAVGGELNTETLVAAYGQGVFPWFNDGQPILWWSPDPRMVLFPQAIKVSRSLKKSLRQSTFHISVDAVFAEVVKNCAERGIDRPLNNKAETWITEEMQSAYLDLFDRGFAHSIEVWQQNELVGGLYGVVLGKVFFGESMFTLQKDASKMALVALCRLLEVLNFELIDCQIESKHLVSMGAVSIPRTQFAIHLRDIVIDPSPKILQHAMRLLYRKERIDVRQLLN